MRERNYIEESQDGRDDISTQLSLSIRVPATYVKQIQNALAREEAGTRDTIRQTSFHRNLSRFINYTGYQDYEFDRPLKLQSVNLDSKKLFSVSFDYPDNEEQDGSPRLTSQRTSTVIFFTRAAHRNLFIKRHSFKLTFKNSIELDHVSDGEYQLLFLYAMIDLFDTPDTLFLLDEADSHLHFQNLEKLWTTLQNIQGKLITTTHLFDSILANQFDNIQIVEKGQIINHEKTRHLIKRLELLSKAETTRFDLWRKLRYIVLMDDFNDWTIFKALAQRKGLDISRLNSIHCIKQSSGYNTTDETFGHAKIEWVNNFCKNNNAIQTSHIFLICDRDNASLKFHANGVLIEKQNSVKNISKNKNLRTYLLAWKRREIENYLLSYTALRHHGILEKINNETLALMHHLKPNDPADNDSIRQLDVKEIIKPLIMAESVGIDKSRLASYIDLIPTEEISEDIENMYKFITEHL